MDINQCNRPNVNQGASRSTSSSSPEGPRDAEQRNHQYQQELHHVQKKQKRKRRKQRKRKIKHNLEAMDEANKRQAALLEQEVPQMPRERVQEFRRAGGDRPATGQSAESSNAGK